MDIEKEVSQQYKVFHKQVDMFDYQKKSLPKGRCFSFEMPNPYMTMGRRKFFVAELDAFWFWYRNVYRLPRHFYEIIQEGLPCRLYFDLEFKKADNPDLNEDKALSEFLQFVCSLINETYHIEVTEKSFLLLDSTTDQKFSVHATCHFPNNYLFPNNVAMREFIAKLTERMSETGNGIVKKESEETFICDPAVYTKNRSFRILLSSKCNKDVIFKYRKDCKFYDELPNEREIFFDSLIVPPDFSKSPLLNVVENKGRVLKRNRILHTVAQASRPISDFAETLDIQTLDAGVPPSPLPELDEFVREFNTQYNPAVEIRSWTLLRVNSTNSLRVQYQLNNCRYCLRISREHVSNNVYWTCHLDREWMYQKCFDYDCRDFMSNFFPLPSALMEQIKPKLDTVFPKASAAAPKLLPPIKPSTAMSKLPPVQKKLRDSFNDSLLDHQVEEMLKKRIRTDEFKLKIPPPKIPKKAEDSFYQTDDEIIIEEKQSKNNNPSASTSDIGIVEKKDIVIPQLIDLTEDGSEKETDTVSPTSKTTPKSKLSTSKASRKKLKISPGTKKLFESKKKSKVAVGVLATEFFKKPVLKRSMNQSKIHITIDDDVDENKSENNQISSTSKRRKKHSVSPDIFASPNISFN
uniref:DNA-directed primase/polymerase protein n=1 Tax=Panagrolaimus superbus TaxID=310955 RepID=A0A914ZE04_9BILA